MLQVERALAAQPSNRLEGWAAQFEFPVEIRFEPLLDSDSARGLQVRRAHLEGAAVETGRSALNALFRLVPGAGDGIWRTEFSHGRVVWEGLVELTGVLTCVARDERGTVCLEIRGRVRVQSGSIVAIRPDRILEAIARDTARFREVPCTPWFAGPSTPHLVRGLDEELQTRDRRLLAGRAGPGRLVVTDVDGDVRDDLYLCRPNGFPNVLWRGSEAGFQEVPGAYGLDVAAGSADAHFADLFGSIEEELVLVGTPW